ncbi:TIGR02117 family protein [Marinobacter salicampi]|uniref:TIGR02117 family protein n=1 Tax=Marinobacter salicampi TaxID=435907 RepID=UPI00140D2841|nr:TIGR02117 family protein [Marinobacter salicampi]
MKAVGLLFVLFVLYGCTAKPHVVEPDTEADGERTVRLYVVSHGWHVGVAIAADQLNPVVPALKERFDGAEYYELGWGDKGFYQAPEITTGVTLRAIVWSRGAVVHVVAVPGSPAEYFGSNDLVHTRINAEEAESLARYLASSFTRDAKGDLVGLKRGIYGESQFYEGEGRYHLLNTSNKWAAKALKSAGMAISPTFKLTADSVMEFVEENRRDCTR